jgi:hypothetical protein
MKRFIDFIDEQSRADLYHGTPFDNVHSILRSGKIKPSDNKRTSLSRDKKYVETGHGTEAYFKIDHDSLRHNHKITPTDWHMGGSVRDKHYEDSMRDPRFRRSEAEESVKGPIHLKHVKELIVHKKHYDELTKPETDFEKEAAHEIKTKSDDAWFYKGMTYKDRMKDVKKLHAGLEKHGIKLTVKDY